MVREGERDQSLNTIYIHFTLWSSTRWHQEQQHRWHIQQGGDMYNLGKKHVFQAMIGWTACYTLAAYTRWSQKKAVSFIIKMHMKLVTFLQHVPWTCLPRASSSLLSCHIMRRSACMAQNHAIWAHIANLETFSDGGRCHKLNAMFIGLQGSLWARKMASPKLIGSTKAGALLMRPIEKWRE